MLDVVARNEAAYYGTANGDACEYLAPGCLLDGRLAGTWSGCGRILPLHNQGGGVDRALKMIEVGWM